MRAGTDELPQVVLANAAGATDPHDGQCSLTDASLHGLTGAAENVRGLVEREQ